MKPSNIFLILGILGLIGSGIYHESAHVQVYASYGIDSEIYLFKYFPDFRTVAEKPCPNDSCIFAQNMIDNLGYQLVSFYLLIFAGLYFLIYVLEGKE